VVTILASCWCTFLKKTNSIDCIFLLGYGAHFHNHHQSGVLRQGDNFISARFDPGVHCPSYTVEV
jgi:hypothetical protein